MPSQTPDTVRHSTITNSLLCPNGHHHSLACHTLLQSHVNDPGHSSESADGRLQLNMHAPYVCGSALSDIVHGCIVYRERAKMAAV